MTFSKNFFQPDMTTRPIHLLLLGSLLFLLFGRAAPAETTGPVRRAQDRPNIIVIMADDLGWQDLHCYGNERLDTPALDQWRPMACASRMPMPRPRFARRRGQR